MNAYVYQAELLCEPCGERQRQSLANDARKPANPEDESSFDSDHYPKGPYANGGGEADTPQHCGHCGVFLENPLTPEGADYTQRIITRDTHNGDVQRVSVETWAPFYGLTASPRFERTLDHETARDAWRQAVLTAMDEAARKIFTGVPLAGRNDTGATDGDLPELFAGVDAQLDRLCERYQVSLVDDCGDERKAGG